MTATAPQAPTDPYTPAAMAEAIHRMNPPRMDPNDMTRGWVCTVHAEDLFVRCGYVYNGRQVWVDARTGSTYLGGRVR